MSDTLYETLVNIKTNVAGYELYCINCKKREMIGNSSSLWSEFKSIVLRDCQCDNCGCNTFDIDAFVDVKIENLRKENTHGC